MLAPLIKRAAEEARQANPAVAIITGKVIRRNELVYPQVNEDKDLLIQTDQKLQLDLDFLKFTVNSSSLKCLVGDEIVLIQIQGGQSYLVLDEAVN